MLMAHDRRAGHRFPRSRPADPWLAAHRSGWIVWTQRDDADPIPHPMPPGQHPLAYLHALEIRFAPVLDGRPGRAWLADADGVAHVTAYFPAQPPAGSTPSPR